MATRSIALLGPGLDGALAIALLQRQQVEVVAATLASVFIKYTAAIEQMAQRLQVPLEILPTGDDYLQRMQHPRFGYTREMAPCLDCKVHMLCAAAELLARHNASFLATGDVVGQRLPGQTKRDLALVDFHAQQEGHVLRPLSAHLLPETEVERAGVIDRSQLLAIQGRGRQAQLALAAELGWTDVPAVTSGCLLADAAYAGRLRTLLAEQPSATRNDFALLRLGKRVTLPGRITLVLGRNREENAELATFAAAGNTLITPHDFIGPTAYVARPLTPEELVAAMQAIWQHRKKSAEELKHAAFFVQQGEERQQMQIAVA